MPSNYIFTCLECGWRDRRYRNLRLCPKCRAPVVREDEEQECYHATNPSIVGRIHSEGFKAGTWFAVHIEHALPFGSVILSVKFKRKYLPKYNWQFHVVTPISPARIIKTLKFESIPRRI